MATKRIGSCAAPVAGVLLFICIGSMLVSVLARRFKNIENTEDILGYCTVDFEMIVGGGKSNIEVDPCFDYIVQ